MLAEGAEVRALTAQLRTDVQQANTAAQTGAEEHVETLCGHTRTAITELESTENMDFYEAARKKGGEEEFMAKITKFEAGVHELAEETRLNIQQMIAESRSAEGSPMKPFQERDQAVFDPRDYKIEVIPTQKSLGIWKRWRHEVEIFVDTIGPSWRGVTFVLQQDRHSAVPLEPTVPGMDRLW